MKKVLKLITIALICLLGINVVKADNCENITMSAEASNISGYPFVRDAIKMNFSSYSEGSMLSLKSDGVELPSYCHNVSKPTGADYGTTIFKCQREIFDTTTSLQASDARNVYDAGLMKILVTGYNVNNTSLKTVGYTATDLAVKTYELLWPSAINSNNMNSGEHKAYLKAYYSFANTMLDDEDIKSLLKDATGSVRSKYSGAVSYTWAQNGDQIESKAKELLVAAFKEAINFKKNGAPSITWNSNPSVSNNITDESASVKKYDSSLAYTFKINKFTSAGAIANVSFNCSNCSANGVTYKVYANDTELGNNYTGAIDLLKYITDGSGEVTVKVVLNTTSNTYNCEELDYKFTVNYKEASISNEAYEMYSTHKSCRGNACQPIYVLKSSNKTKTAVIEDSFAMCTITCEELKAKCSADGAGSKACQEFKKQYPKGCVNCGVGIKNNECAEPGGTSTLDLIEGYEIDSATCKQSDKANVEGCILENKDAAGNSYEYMNNGLCSVSCKEDFHFNLPGNIDVSSGRYFTLKTDVKATKTCYLKMNGNPSSVASAFSDGAKKTQEGYDTCAAGKAIAKLTVNDFKKGEEVEVTCGKENDVIFQTTYMGYTSLASCQSNVHPLFKSLCSVFTSTKRIDTSNEVKGKISKYTATYEYETGCCTTCKGKGEIEIVQEVENVNGKCEPTKDIKTLIQEKLDELNEQNEEACSILENLTSKASVTTYTIGGVGGIKPYVYSGTYTVSTGGSSESIYKGLGAYNACAVWEMDYDFNPDMYYNYEESYMKDVLTEKLDLVGNISKGSTTHYYCQRNDGDSAYESCSSGWKTEPIFSSQSFCVCNTEECKTESIAINNTLRMKESITYTAAYITPTQFYQIYPTGTIVTSKTDLSVENSKELTNALPVGLGTPQGGHSYALYAKNLGEYYNTGKFGRIWGSKNSVVAITLKSLNKCAINGALKYDTKINDTYIDKGVWECKYCVNGDCGESTDKCKIENGKYYYDNKEISYSQYVNDYHCDNNNKVCIHETHKVEVDMTDCLNNHNNDYDYCKKILCCPECVLTFQCLKVNGKYYGDIVGVEVTEDVYKEQCTCAIRDGKYYGLNGFIISEKQYRSECCPSCPVYVSIYNNFTYRAISLNDINPNNRNLGPNWRYDDQQINTALQMKAKATVDEIITDGETIYDESTNKYVMKINMDSALINTIKSRKDKKYTENTLSCYDYEQDGTVYKNIFCYSKFIDELLTDSKTKDKIKFSVERPLNESDRKNSQKSEYWTTWTKKLENSKWNVKTVRELSYYKSNYGEIGIGPSWK